MPRSIAKRKKNSKRAKSMRVCWEQRRNQMEDNSNDSSHLNVVKNNITADYSSDNPSDRNIENCQSRVLYTHSNFPNTDVIIDIDNDGFSSHASAWEVENYRTTVPNWNKNSYERKNVAQMEKLEVTQLESDLAKEEEWLSVDQHQLHIESELQPKTKSVIQGNRIVELGYLLNQVIDLQFIHSKMCTTGKLCIKNEITRGKGLTSQIIFQCNICDKLFECSTESPNKLNSEVTVGAVWGTLASGQTYEHTAELLSCMNIPCMNRNVFYNLESKLGKVWDNSLVKSMEAAAVREKELAIAENRLCPDGVPWITVYVDGSWSKRSYGTNYNSLSGMAAIIGKNTGEVLFIGVRNRFCSICARAEAKNMVAKDHTCFKNWNGSAPGMESNIIVEGFQLSETLYGLRYLKFIGDGDSSVFSKIQDCVPYGRNVIKIECTNHVLKNYGKRLRNTKSDTNISLEGRKLLTINKINLLTKRAKCSIYEHSKRQGENVNQLRNDLRNGLHHVFGDHSSCRSEICNTPGEDQTSVIAELKRTLIYNHLRGDLDLLVRKSHLLIENENNNQAERLMNVIARFCDGKRLNLIQRGSYKHRVHLSALRYNKSVSWHCSPYKTITGSSPGVYFKKFINDRMNRNTWKARKRLLDENTGDNNYCVKKKPKVETKISKSNTDYGPKVEETENADMLENEVKNIIERLKVTEVQRDDIQIRSIGQFGNEFFVLERQHRLTASLFGRVAKRRPYTPCHTIVKACLSSRQFWAEATEYGIAKEKVAVSLFEKKTNLTVSDSGLWVDLDHGFLGASPDGVIYEENAIIEVKCLFSASKLQLNTNTIDEIVEKMKGKICLEKTKTGQVQLKRKHEYYWQIQGQLNISRKEKCYFVVYVSDKIELFVEEIIRDEQFWKATLPVLIQFYQECIAPEIVRNRIQKGLKCKDPPYIHEAIELHQKKKNVNELGFVDANK